MKKSFARRVLVMAMAMCMVLSMVAPVSAAYKYTLELHITEEKTTLKPNSHVESKIVVETESSSLSDGDDLTDELVGLLATKFDSREAGTLWDFESDAMGLTIEAGLKAYRKNDGGTAWDEWLDTFAREGRITGDGADKGDLVTLLKNKAKISDMDYNTEYVLYYEPDNTVKLNPALNMTLADEDPAKGNTYIFTLTLVRSVIGGGGGGSSDYAITVGAVPNGSAQANVNRAEAGEKVTITVKTDEGYEVAAVKVAQGTKDIAVTDNGDGTYSFTMPAGRVVVTVTTKAKSVNPYDPAAPGHSDNCLAAKYDDVDLNEWYHTAICYVLDNGLMTGYDEDTFGPNDPLSRAMVAQIFYNMEGQPAGEYENPFPDVTEGKWHYNAISWAYEHGVVSGYGDGLYRPDKDVSREELVQIFCNYAKANGWVDAEHADLTSFDDHHEVASWHEVAVQWGVGAGLLGGKGGNLIAPVDNAIRAEAAQMLMNMCENIKK